MWTRNTPEIIIGHRQERISGEVAVYRRAIVCKKKRKARKVKVKRDYIRGLITKPGSNNEGDNAMFIKGTSEA